MKNVVASILGLFFTVGAYADGATQSAIETKDVPLVIRTPLESRRTAPGVQALPPVNGRLENDDPLQIVDNGSSRAQQIQPGFRMPWKATIRTIQEMGFERGRTQVAAREPVRPGQIEKSPIEFVVIDDSPESARKFVNIFEKDLRTLWKEFTMSRDLERRLEARKELRSAIDVLNDFNPRSPHLVYANLYLHGILKSIHAAFDLSDAGGITFRFLELLSGFRPKAEETKSLLMDIAKAALRSDQPRVQSYALEIMSVISGEQATTQGHRQTDVLSTLQKAIDGNIFLDSVLQLKAYAIISTMTPATDYVVKLRQQLLFKYLPQYGQDSDSAMALAGGDALVRSVDIKDSATQYYAELYVRGILKNILASLESRGADPINFKWVLLVTGLDFKSEETKSLVFDIAKAAFSLDDSRIQLAAIDLFRGLSTAQSATQAHRQVQILSVLQESLDSNRLKDEMVFEAYSTLSLMKPATAHVAKLRQQLIFKYLAQVDSSSPHRDQVGFDAMREASRAKDAPTQMRIVQNAQATILANVQSPREASYLEALEALDLIDPVNSWVAIEKASALATIIRLAPEKLRAKTSALFQHSLAELENIAQTEANLKVMHFRVMDNLIGNEADWQNQLAFSESKVVQGKILTQLLALSSLQTDSVESFSRKIRIISAVLLSPNPILRDMAVGILRDEVSIVSKRADRTAGQMLASVAGVVAENLRNTNTQYKNQTYLISLLNIFTYVNWAPRIRFQPESAAQVLREINRLAPNNSNLTQYVRKGLADMVMRGDVSCDKLLRAVHPYQ